jgi:hypothetical protein
MASPTASWITNPVCRQFFKPANSKLGQPNSRFGPLQFQGP